MKRPKLWTLPRPLWCDRIAHHQSNYGNLGAQGGNQHISKKAMETEANCWSKNGNALRFNQFPVWDGIRNRHGYFQGQYLNLNCTYSHGCFFGILIFRLQNNPHINWVLSKFPIYPKQPIGFFHCSNMIFNTEACHGCKVRTTETLMGKAPSRIDQSLGDGNRKSLEWLDDWQGFAPNTNAFLFFWGGRK